MSKHLFGIVLTGYGIASNNRGDSDGSITNLQKIMWQGEQHTTVSAEAIRFGIRNYWQNRGWAECMNRRWDESEKRPGNIWRQPNFEPWLQDAPDGYRKGKRFLDDDVLGFMRAESGREETNRAESGGKKVDITIEVVDGGESSKNKTSAKTILCPVGKDTDKPLSEFRFSKEDIPFVEIDAIGGEDKEKKAQEKIAPKVVFGDDKGRVLRVTPAKAHIGSHKVTLKVVKTIIRRSRLEVTRAVSLSPFADGGDVTFNAASINATPSAQKRGENPAPYGTEIHATRYQYGFALTPESLDHDQVDRAEKVVDAIVNLTSVGGNHARFLFDFSPETIVFRWTKDFAPRILYGFSQARDEDNRPTGKLNISEVIRKLKAEDIKPCELIIGGELVQADKAALECEGVQSKQIFAGVRAAADKIKCWIKKDLNSAESPK